MAKLYIPTNYSGIAYFSIIRAIMKVNIRSTNTGAMIRSILVYGNAIPIH